jgi:Zn ribbon nucleic-acid-binding protein
MQAKCPKCNGTAFRMLPGSSKATEVECLNCGHVTIFGATVMPQTIGTQPPRDRKLIGT